MKKFTWVKLRTELHPNGEKTVVWVLPDAPGIRIESRTTAIPHANGQGYWWKTFYYVIHKDGEEKEFNLLCLAKSYVEVAFT